MKYNVTEFLLENRIFKVSISEISDKVYVDFGNDLTINDFININIIYDSEIDKTYLDNAFVYNHKGYIFLVHKNTLDEKILTINKNEQK